MADAQVLRTADALPLQAVSLSRPRRRVRRFGLQGSELTWAVAFVIPYAAVFLAFVAYPVVYGLWLGRDPALYAELITRGADRPFRYPPLPPVIYGAIFDPPLKFRPPPPTPP